MRKTPSRTCLWQCFRYVGGAKARVVECSEGEDSNAGFSQAACAAQWHPRGTCPLPNFHAYLVPKNEQALPSDCEAGALKLKGLGQEAGCQTAWRERDYSDTSFRNRGLSVGVAGKRCSRSDSSGGEKLRGNNGRNAATGAGGSRTHVTALWRSLAYSRDAVAGSATTPSCLLPGTR